MSKKQERRYFRTELRAIKEDGKTKLVGYAAVFNSQSENLGGFREVVKPGAFQRTLKESADVRCLFNHDPNMVMGRSKSGTLRLMEDDKGLRMECDMPDTQQARDLMTLVERGDIDQMSFGFYTRADNWKPAPPESDVSEMRELLDVELTDVSAVTFPAYTATSVEARNLWPSGIPADVRGHRDMMDDMDPDADQDIEGVDDPDAQEDLDAEEEDRTVVEVPGHKDANGEDAPWCIKSEKDGTILASFKTKQEAEDQLKVMMAHQENSHNPSDEVATLLLWTQHRMRE